MKRTPLVPFAVCALLGACTAPGVIGIWPHANTNTDASPDAYPYAVSDAARPGPGCDLEDPAFCETFDTSASTSSRSGQLDSTIWRVSRCTGNVNIGQGDHNAWMTTQEVLCGQTVTVQPPDDVNICNGRLVEATNDNDTVTTLSMSVTQPFDIAGRTGIVTFDVSNNSGGRQWPQLEFADEPATAAYAFLDTWGALPKNGLAISLGGACAPDQGCGGCPGATPYPRVGFSGAVVFSDYARNDFGMAFADSRVTLFDCVATARTPDELNRFELHIAQNEIEIYGADASAGGGAPLKKLVAIRDVNLNLTRGYLSLQDVHNHGDAAGGLGTNTFAWDNFGFDGPRLRRDLAFQANDSLVPRGDGRVNLGWLVALESPPDIMVPGVRDIDKASAGWLTVTLKLEYENLNIAYSVNGNPEHSVPSQFPTPQPVSWRTMALPVPLTEMVPGANTIRFSTKDLPFVVANVDLVLTGAGG